MPKIQPVSKRQREMLSLSARERNLPGQKQQRMQFLRELSARAKQELPRTAFAIPEKRAYPIHTAEMARASLSEVAAKGTVKEQARVRQAVERRYPQGQV